MGEDYIGEIGPVRPFRLTLYSNRYSVDAAKGWAAWLALVLGSVVYFVMFRYVKLPVALAGAVLLSAAAGGAIAWNVASDKYATFAETEYR